MKERIKSRTRVVDSATGSGFGGTFPNGVEGRTVRIESPGLTSSLTTRTGCTWVALLSKKMIVMIGYEYYESELEVKNHSSTWPVYIV